MTHNNQSFCITENVVHHRARHTARISFIRKTKKKKMKEGVYSIIKEVYYLYMLYAVFYPMYVLSLYI